MGCSNETIGYAARRSGRTACGYKWKYVKGESLKVVNGKPIGQYDKDGTYVASYRSATEAARSINGYADYISRVARRKAKSAYGYIWKYLDKENK